MRFGGLHRAGGVIICRVRQSLEPADVWPRAPAPACWRRPGVVGFAR
jgi:hypothetical protein